MFPAFLSVRCVPICKSATAAASDILARNCRLSEVSFSSGVSMKSLKIAFEINDKFVLSLACLDQMQRTHDFRHDMVPDEDSERVMREYFLTFRVLDRQIRELRSLVQNGV